MILLPRLNYITSNVSFSVHSPLAHRPSLAHSRLKTDPSPSSAQIMLVSPRTDKHSGRICCAHRFFFICSSFSLIFSCGSAWHQATLWRTLCVSSFVRRPSLFTQKPPQVKPSENGPDYRLFKIDINK